MRWQDDEGMSLIGVTWVILLLSILAAGVLRASLTSNKLVSSLELDTQNRLTAESAVTLFVRSVFYDPDQRAYSGGTLTADGLDVVVDVEFESGKVDLNRASEPLLSALFASSGQDLDRARTLAAAVVDWRDGDDESGGVGAERAEYESAGRSHGPRNGAFETLGELRHVLGITDDIFACVAPMITVYSLSDAVEVHFAQESVLNVLRWANDRRWEDVAWPDVDLILAEPFDFENLNLNGKSFLLRVSLLGEPAQKFRQLIRLRTTDDMSFRPLTAIVRDYRLATPQGCLFSSY